MSLKSQDISPENSYPVSWYQIAWSEEVPKNKIKAVTFCGRDLVVFRGENGKVSVLDAYCPHLGAHLAVKGKICGNEIRCAFHGWQFDGEGKCTRNSSDSKITPNMHTKAWRVEERYGIIFVHFDPERKHTDEKFYNVEILDEGDWGKPIGHPHEIFARQSCVLENGVDMEHFTSVHGVPMNEAKLQENERGNLSFHHQTAPTKLGIKFNTMMDIEYPIPGLQIIHLHSVFGRECVALSSVTPIKNGKVVAHLTTRVREQGSRIATKIITRAVSYFLNKTFAEDIPIWNSQIFREKPVLAQGDEGIQRFRKWYGRFPVAS